MEDSAIEVQPDPVLLPQVISQLTNLAVHLGHGRDILLCLSGHFGTQLLHLLRPLYEKTPQHCHMVASLLRSKDCVVRRDAVELMA